MKHVSWPSRQQVGIFTVLVVGASLATSLFLGLFDYAFSTALSTVLPVAPAAPAARPVPDATAAPETAPKPSDIQIKQEPVTKPVAPKTDFQFDVH